MEPITFAPLFMERVWGGQKLADAFGKALPAGRSIGESWEIVDREDAQSRVAGAGSRAGRTLHELWTGPDRAALFGARAVRAAGDRFPILVKLLDARDRLSVQVHPSAASAAAYGGEPKNEMWFVVDAEPEAHLLAGLRAGVTQSAFRAALESDGDVSALLHRIDVRPGDTLFIPSGRVHAIGPGCLIVEIQQNSDTTYRVFDYNRPGLEGEPRELHVEQSLASIDWDDVEPDVRHVTDGPILANDHFAVARRQVQEATRLTAPGECAFVCVLQGSLHAGATALHAGDVALLPADGDGVASGPADVLVVELPG